ncbi:MAG: glycosyltransferase [Solirubrobacteraceae bacterium]
MVSVVIPVHNPGEYLREAIESALAQSEPRLEVIVIDDASDRDDVSWTKVLDPRIKLLRLTRSGVSIARNVGVQIAEADLIAFLDQDDVWCEEKLEHQLEGLRTQGVVLSHTGFTLIDGNGTAIGPGYGCAVDYQDMLRGEMGVLCSSAVVCKDALVRVGGFSPVLRKQQDLDLFLRLAQFGRFHYVPDELVRYRLHGSNASREHWLTAQEMLATFRLHGVAGDRSISRALREGRRRARRNYAYQAIDAARDRSATPSPKDAALALTHAGLLSPLTLIRAVAIGARRRLRSAMYPVDQDF